MTIRTRVKAAQAVVMRRRFCGDFIGKVTSHISMQEQSDREIRSLKMLEREIPWQKRTEYHVSKWKLVPVLSELPDMFGALSREMEVQKSMGYVKYQSRIAKVGTKQGGDL